MSCEAEWWKLEVPAMLYTQHSWNGSWPITILGGNKLFSIRKTNSTLAEVIKLSSTGTARPINDIEKWICFTYGTGLVGPIYDKVCCTKANPGWFTLTYNMPLQPIHTGWTANHTTYQDIWIEVVQTLCTAIQMQASVLPSLSSGSNKVLLRFCKQVFVPDDLTFSVRSPSAFKCWLN